MIVETLSKEVRRWIERVRMPSGQCQACLSDKSLDKDFMITCDLCQSSIHNKHYGRQIDQSQTPPLDKWRCERCRMICLLASQQKLHEIEDSLKCYFCPNRRGILKRVIYNGNQTIWLHPQCSTWSYPIIYQKNNRRIHYNCEYPNRPTGKFWVNLDNQKTAPCQICKETMGYKIKCMYYLCQKYYHCSCAKIIGFIRDLQSMHFQNCDTYIPPYCQEHLQKRIADCAIKMKKYKTLRDQGKTSHFSQMMTAYQAQLKNMQKSAKKHKEQEQIRMQMEYQAGEKEDVMEEISFSEQNSFHSQHPLEFYQYIFDSDYPKRTSPIGRHSFANNKPSSSNQMIDENLQPLLVPQLKQGAEDIIANIQGLLKGVDGPRIKNYDKYSDPQESEWNNSQDFQEESE